MTIISLIVAAIISIPSFITIFPLIPHVELQVNLISRGEVHPFYNTNRTIITGLNVTIPTTISNTGNVPIHIAACDVFMTNEAKPTNLTDQIIGEVMYLKADDSFTYNFTKYFDVSVPITNMTVGDAMDIIKNYLLLVVYYTKNSQDTQCHWVDVAQYIESIEK